MLKCFNIKNNKKPLLVTDKYSVLSTVKQKGFTLVTVLILSAVASILVLNSLKDNVNQERLSGNFQKEINARLASERGIFDSISAVQSYITDNQGASIADLIANIGDITNETTLTYGGMQYDVQMSEATPGELLLSSVGNRFEGESTLTARLKIVSTGGGAVYSDAVVGCEGVDLAGSGQIDSYDSSVSAYDANNHGSEGNVSTIDESGADVTLGGNSPVFGDIKSTGNIDTSSSNVDGSLYANGNIIIGQTDDQVRVTGNVLTRGNYTQLGGRILGVVRANGNASMTWDNFIMNEANDDIDILYSDKDILYGGSGSFDDIYNNKLYKASLYNVNPDVPKVKSSDNTASGYDASDPGSNCDYLGIESVLKAVDNTSITQDFESNSNQRYAMEPTKLYNADTTASIASSVTSSFFDTSLEVIKLQSFELRGSASMTVSGGDVTLFVKGDFTMGGATTITIAAGSSLTLIIEGVVTLGNGADIFALQHGLANPPNLLPAMSIYSSYEGEGINISGHFETYAQIYAPFSDIDISGSGTLYGSVRGKTITVTGGAAIHYDSALQESGRNNGSSSQSTLAFLGWVY